MSGISVGTDLVHIPSFAQQLELPGTRFAQVFSASELRVAQARGLSGAARAQHLAGRWAAKEACSKALGTGLRMGIAWRDMAVSNLRTGQPVMQLTGWAAGRLEAMTPAGHVARVHVTLTDDHPWAQAFVVIEALPAANLDSGTGAHHDGRNC